jgi:hypothetical protein
MPDGGIDGGACVDTWTNYASGFFSRVCGACHGTVYSDYGMASGSPVPGFVCSQIMPPSSDAGLDPATLARIGGWFACGAPQ